MTDTDGKCCLKVQNKAKYLSYLNKCTYSALRKCRTDLLYYICCFPQCRNFKEHKFLYTSMYFVAYIPISFITICNFKPDP